MTATTLMTANAEANSAPVNTFLTDYAVSAELLAFLDDYADGLNSYTYVKLSDTEATFHRQGDSAFVTLPIAHAAAALGELRSHAAMAVKWPGMSNSNYMELSKRFAKRGYSLPNRIRDGQVIKDQNEVKVMGKSKVGKIQDVTTILASLVAAKASVASIERNLASIVESAKASEKTIIAALDAAQNDANALHAALQAPLSAALKATFDAAYTAAQLQAEHCIAELAIAQKNIVALQDAGLISASIEVTVTA
jgi:hypothetical protein